MLAAFLKHRTIFDEDGPKAFRRRKPRSAVFWYGPNATKNSNSTRYLDVYLWRWIPSDIVAVFWLLKK
jgi:hypothetical protein